MTEDTRQGKTEIQAKDTELFKATYETPISSRPTINSISTSVRRQDFDELMKTLEGLPRLPSKWEPMLISNSVEPITIVDYERELYINSYLPAFGKADFAAKLSPELTLSEASAKPESQPEKLASLIPIHELITTFLDPKQADSLQMLAGLTRQQNPVRFQVSITEVGYLRDYVRIWQKDPRKAGEKIFADSTGAFSIRELGSLKGQTSDKAGDEKGAFRFSGEVRVPKTGGP